MEIKFVLDGVEYVVGMKAYNHPIILPDQRVLEAENWALSAPPIPIGLHVVHENYQDMPPEQMAALLSEAAVATVA